MLLPNVEMDIILVCISLLGLLLHYGLGDLKNRNLLSHSSGGQKSKIKESAGLVVSEGSDPGLPPLLVDGYLLSVSSHCFRFLFS